MVVDGAGADEHLSRNLWIRCPPRGELSDFEFLRGEVVLGLDSSVNGVFAGGEKFTRARSANPVAPIVSNAS